MESTSTSPPTAGCSISIPNLFRSFLNFLELNLIPFVRALKAKAEDISDGSVYLVECRLRNGL